MEYMLVPVEPTEQMVEAGTEAGRVYVQCGDDPYLDNADQVYGAMLAAAPEPGWVKIGERLPTQEDADESGLVWMLNDGGVFGAFWDIAYRYGKIKEDMIGDI